MSTDPFAPPPMPSEFMNDGTGTGPGSNESFK